jgi:hypothetical protein
MVCDKMHSMDGTEENPVTGTAKAGNHTITFKSPKVRINTGTKIYTIIENTLIGGAGDFNKIQTYIENIKKSNSETIIMDTLKYFEYNGINSPDQLLILQKKNGNGVANAIYQEQNPSQFDEIIGFHNCQFVLNETNLGVLAIGSGGPLFLQMYLTRKNDHLKNYKKSIEENSYEKWEQDFIAKIKQMYQDVSKYDDAVSAEVEIYSI